MMIMTVALVTISSYALGCLTGWVLRQRSMEYDYMKYCEENKRRNKENFFEKYKEGYK